jgi:hypothetical protein
MPAAGVLALGVHPIGDSPPVPQASVRFVSFGELGPDGMIASSTLAYDDQ